jgi:hypothetical protein
MDVFSTDGGTPITVYGRNFINNEHLACRFANAGVDGSALVSPGRWVSSTEIRCLSPASSTPKSVDVSVTLNGVEYSDEVQVLDRFLRNETHSYCIVVFP